MQYPLSKKLLIWLCLVTLLSTTAAAPITAAPLIDYSANNVEFFEPTSKICKTGDLPTSLSGKENREKAFRYFLQKKLTPEQSAGIVGNLMQESGVDPNADQPNGPGRGIAQWSEGDRWQNLLDYARVRKIGERDLGLQLDFLWHELTTSYTDTLTALKGATNIADATRIFEEGYERAGKPNMPARIKFAQQVYDEFADKAVSPGAGTATENCSDAVGSGKDTKYVEGFLVYNQCDPAWKNLPFGDTTICVAGCGPSAMAMIITALTGDRVTPVDTSRYADSRGLYVKGAGSSWAIAPTLANHWGLESEFIGADVGAISKALQSGKLVIASGGGPKPFTSGGHYLVIRGLTADGKFKIGDSGHSDTSDKTWDPQQLVGNMRDGSVYAISKR